MAYPKSPQIAGALAMVAAGVSIREASRQTGLAPSTISRALALQARPVCPCCGQVIVKKRAPKKGQ